MSSIFLCSTLEKISLNEAVDFLMEISKDDKRLDVYDSPRAKRHFLEKALLKNLHSQILVINENFIYDEFDQQFYDMSKTEVDKYSFMLWAKDSDFNVPEILLKKTKFFESYEEKKIIGGEDELSSSEKKELTRLRGLEKKIPGIIKTAIFAYRIANNFEREGRELTKEKLKEILRREGCIIPKGEYFEIIRGYIPDDLKNTGGNPRVAKK